MPMLVPICIYMKTPIVIMAIFTGLHVGYVDCSVFLKAIAQYGKVAILNRSVTSIAKVLHKYVCIVWGIFLYQFSAYG